MYWSKKNNWFDKYSFLHCGSLAFFYTIFLLLALLKNIKTKGAIILFIIINTLHLIDELLNNYSTISMESIWVPKYLGRVVKDNDSIQNFLGDLISGLMGSLIVLLVFYFSEKNKYQPLIVLFTGFILFCVGLMGWLIF